MQHVGRVKRPTGVILAYVRRSLAPRAREARREMRTTGDHDVVRAFKRTTRFDMAAYG